MWVAPEKMSQLCPFVATLARSIYPNVGCVVLLGNVGALCLTPFARAIQCKPVERQ